MCIVDVLVGAVGVENRNPIDRPFDGTREPVGTLVASGHGLDAVGKACEAVGPDGGDHVRRAGGECLLGQSVRRVREHEDR